MVNPWMVILIHGEGSLIRVGQIKLCDFAMWIGDIIENG